MNDNDRVSFWIDDIKIPDFPVDLICRNGVLAISLLIYLKVSDLYIDHDLGLDVPNGAEILDRFFTAMKYYHTDLPERIFIISKNPVGRINMEQIIIETEQYYRGEEGQFILK